MFHVPILQWWNSGESRMVCAGYICCQGHAECTYATPLISRSRRYLLSAALREDQSEQKLGMQLLAHPAAWR
jgi:hypothetical protein